ncbi:MAG: hypothetical protein ABUM26_07455, partial [Solirubrobacterales bacterium]
MSSVLHSMTLRWRLAALAAGLTFLVLCGFALVIGQLTASRIRSDFRNEMSTAVNNLLSNGLPLKYENDTATIPESLVRTYAAPNQAVIRVLFKNGAQIAATERAPDFGKLGLRPGQTGEIGGYRVETRATTLALADSPLRFPVLVQYARRTAPVEASVHRVRVILIVGVLLGSSLALGLALALSRRALTPLTRLTATARDIAATRDPSRRVPTPDPEDE